MPLKCHFTVLFGLVTKSTTQKVLATGKEEETQTIVIAVSFCEVKCGRKPLKNKHTPEHSFLL